jgi:N-acetylglucosamine kinase-like BadF-type ATPase
MTWMGIDGGGSNLRVVITDDEMNVLASAQGPAANPSAVGRAQAAGRIGAAIREALYDARLKTVTGAAIGVAGASADHSARWLREVLGPRLPGAQIVPSSDEEIALVGARGQLDGLVLLAGTGSVAYGRSIHGDHLRAGGWGYLLGDEGSGYWIGLQAARSVTLAADGRLDIETRLPAAVMEAIGLEQHRDMIQWMYHETEPRDVAQLAPLVLALSDEGDPGAQRIVEAAAAHLAALAEHVRTTLALPLESIVYAGGLLTVENALRQQVTQALGLAQLPDCRYPPVVGAALLAKLTTEKQ